MIAKETLRTEEYLFSTFPITYNSLVVENTTHCTAKCGMCYQAASPKGSELLGSSKLSTEVIKRFLREAINIPTLKRRFHLAGGEAFLDIYSCLECFKEARNLGYFEISTTTNAYWARDAEKANRVCQDLRKAGLTRMEISWDAWHFPFIPSQAINNCIKYAYQNNIETNLRLLATKKERFDAAIEALDSNVLPYADVVVCGSVMHLGRAADTIPESEIFDQKNLGSSCHHLLNLTVNATGDVFPCCAGFDQTKNVHFGNVKEMSIVDIAENMNKSLLLRLLVFSGAGSLVPILEDAGFSIGRNFTSLCSLCWQIFSDAEKVNALKTYFDEIQKKNEFQEFN